MAFTIKDFPNLVFESFEDYREHLKRRKQLLAVKREDGQIEAIFIKVDKEDIDAYSQITFGREPD